MGSSPRSSVLQNRWPSSQHAYFFILACCEGLDGRKCNSVGSLTLLDSRGHLKFCCVSFMPVLSVPEDGDVLCTITPGLCIQLTHAWISLGEVKFARGNSFGHFRTHKSRPKTASFIRKGLNVQEGLYWKDDVGIVMCDLNDKIGAVPLLAFITVYSSSYFPVNLRNVILAITHEIRDCDFHEICKTFF